MKMKSVLSILLLLPFSFLLSPSNAQVPQGFNYQAIARDGSGNPIVNATISVRLSILSDSSGFYPGGFGTYVWEETHSGVKTNAYGLFNIIFGNPLAVKVQGTAGSFSAINWSSGPLYIGTKIYYPAAWKTMGAAQLWTVPYSMVAGDLSGAVKKLAVTGTTTNMDEALFEVKNKTGQTVFAVYNEGVRVYVDDGLAKGQKGGFAIGGFGTGKAASQPYFVVAPDSIRAYIGTNPAKGLKGGFAIGGFSGAKAPDEEYLRVSRDSTRVYVREPIKGQKGGFAIGSFSAAKAAATNYLDLTPNNYFIGQEAGLANTSGLYNSFMGFQNGFSNTTGSQNVFLGFKSGYLNTTGSSNVFIGNQVAYYNTTGERNVALGKEAGVGLALGTSYFDNVFLGYRSGFSNNAGYSNVFAGTESGYTNGSGFNNVFIGYRNGYSNTSGNNNTFIGTESGFSNTYGYYNVFLGNLSGRSNIVGNQNVMIGHQAGKASQDGNYNVYIGQSAAEINVHGSGNTAVGMFSGNQMNGAEWNTFIGAYSGMWASTGTSNVGIGTSAGYSNGAALQNTYLGSAAGGFHSIGDKNIYVGYMSGYNQNTGSNNIFLGSEAGYNSTNVTGNILIGYRAGYNETSSNRLYIENSSADKNSALVYGEFDTKKLTVNGYMGIGKTSPVTRLDILGGNWNVGVGSEGDVRIGDASYRLKIGVATAGGGAGDVRVNAMGGLSRILFGGNGVDVLIVNSTSVVPAGDNIIPLGASGNRWTTVYAANGTINTSDARLKSNIQDLNYGLESIMNLNPVSFSWKDDKLNVKRLGLIAQDVEKIISEVVDKGNDPSQTLGINYSELVPVLIKGMQEQQRQIETARQDNLELKKEIQSLKESIEQIKASISADKLK
jgi:trimeric autotransporter adhesin